jgi:hypothetical protein
MKTLPFIPKQAEVDASSSSEGATPETLCANWKRGCNGVTDGPKNGRLTYCDYCADESEKDK